MKHNVSAGVSKYKEQGLYYENITLFLSSEKNQ